RVNRLQETDAPESWFIHKLLENPAKLLQVILIGNELVNTTTAVLVAAICFSWLHGKVHPIIVALAPVVLTAPLLIVLGEIIPKAIAGRLPEVMARINAPWLALFAFVTTPLQWLLGYLVAWFLPIFLRVPTRQGLGQVVNVNKETFRSMLDLGQSE